MPGDRQSLTERVRLAERRRQALYLVAVRGFTIDQVARILEVSSRTICRDLKVARENARQQLEQQAEIATRISDLAAAIDQTFVAALTEAWTEFYGAGQGTPARTRALQAVISANERRAAHLRQLGLLREASEQTATGVGFFGLTDEQLAAAIKEGQGDGENE
jgi:predicted DNA-binding protein (UPF0251 family)